MVMLSERNEITMPCGFCSGGSECNSKHRKIDPTLHSDVP